MNHGQVSGARLWETVASTIRVPRRRGHGHLTHIRQFVAASLRAADRIQASVSTSRHPNPR
ncbi:hypothetical protein [Streptomyces sp. GQFP]|uniref:hypothetical protein n=1 Tax=Streptomyces sp. GQFP TaxID=2907545 RepID=UPI001F36DEEF|nr:hypothetical protein [Streptomyces sp. GQFP]UIX29468.1 hypothetical protein LUX31_05120 [Streptomyces sp. GQFP]